MELSLGSLITFFKMGGPLMWPLLAFGLLGLGIALERALYFFTTGYPVERLETELNEGLGDGKTTRPVPDESLLERWLPAAAMRRRASPWRRLADEFLARRGGNVQVLDSHLERLGAGLVEEMRRGVGVLAMIAGAAPLVGLLGTIGGMMLAFQQIAATGGQADIGQLADGLWVAMITTFAGLSVAIPAQLAYGYFQSLVRRR
ncbi:MAG: MotA/TolQ/ExbB proton channel family protein, partial [Leptospirales bacterium]